MQPSAVSNIVSETITDPAALAAYKAVHGAQSAAAQAECQATPGTAHEQEEDGLADLPTLLGTGEGSLQAAIEAEQVQAQAEVGVDEDLTQAPSPSAYPAAAPLMTPEDERMVAEGLDRLGSSLDALGALVPPGSGDATVAGLSPSAATAKGQAAEAGAASAPCSSQLVGEPAPATAPALHACGQATAPLGNGVSASAEATATGQALVQQPTSSAAATTAALAGQGGPEPEDPAAPLLDSEGAGRCAAAPGLSQASGANAFDFMDLDGPLLAPQHAGGLEAGGIAAATAQPADRAGGAGLVEEVPPGDTGRGLDGQCAHLASQLDTGGRGPEPAGPSHQQVGGGACDELVG